MSPLPNLDTSCKRWPPTYCLRLNCPVKKINQFGHPDIVAARGTEELRFEIEAEVSGPRPRQLTDEDFASLIDSSGAVGYFALGYQLPYAALDSGSSRAPKGQKTKFQRIAGSPQR